jgi:hypothetical protein
MNARGQIRGQMIEPIFAITPELPTNILVSENANMPRCQFQPLDLDVTPGAGVFGFLVLFPAHNLFSEGKNPFTTLVQVFMPDREA